MAGIVLVLLVADPVASAATALGRWLNGALYGALVLLFAHGWAGAAPVQMASRRRCWHRWPRRSSTRSR